MDALLLISPLKPSRLESELGWEEVSGLQKRYLYDGGGGDLCRTQFFSVSLEQEDQSYTL